jgi:hypothetical protein
MASMHFSSYVPTPEDPIVKQMEHCPICTEPPIEICDCTYQDSKCRNGHAWYYNKQKNEICLGHGHPEDEE